MTAPVPPTIPKKLERFLDGIGLIDDRAERIQALIEIAERFKAVPESIARRPFGEDHKVPACESQAFVWALPQPDRTLKYWFAVENPQGISAKALAVILDDTLSGAPVAEVAAVTGDVVYRIFGNELSMGKSMGLMGMVSMIQLEAKKSLTKNGSDPLA
jgi:cysteine desulfuration protein SufE